MNLKQTTPDSKENNLISKLYIVSTPIGNLGDISLRAIETLKSVNRIICEDTRQTNKLLAHYNIKKSLLVYNDHSTESDREKITDLLSSGLTMALVSDAGTPLISDPGYKLINHIKNNGIEVTAIPGCCAAITGLTLSTLPTNRFSFLGFLPPKQHKRLEELESAKNIQATLIFYESAKRIVESIADIKTCFGEVKVAVCRELTRKFEEIISGQISDVENQLQQRQIKGEIVLLIDNNETEASHIDLSDKYIAQMADKLGAKTTSQILSELMGISKKDLYNRILQLKQNEAQ